MTRIEIYEHFHEFPADNHVSLHEHFRAAINRMVIVIKNSYRPELEAEQVNFAILKEFANKNEAGEINAAVLKPKDRALLPLAMMFMEKRYYSVDKGFSFEFRLQEQTLEELSELFSQLVQNLAPKVQDEEDELEDAGEIYYEIFDLIVSGEFISEERRKRLETLLEKLGREEEMKSKDDNENLDEVFSHSEALTKRIMQAVERINSPQQFSEESMDPDTINSDMVFYTFHSKLKEAGLFDENSFPQPAFTLEGGDLKNMEELFDQAFQAAENLDMEITDTKELEALCVQMVKVIQKYPKY